MVTTPDEIEAACAVAGVVLALAAPAIKWAVAMTARVTKLEVMVSEIGKVVLPDDVKEKLKL